MDWKLNHPAGEGHNPLIARVVSTAAGAWLFVSAFLWPQADAQRVSSMLAGVVIVGVSLLRERAPELGFLHAIVALWLFVSSFALPVVSGATVLNNLLVAIVIFAASMADYVPRGPAHPLTH